MAIVGTSMLFIEDGSALGSFHVYLVGCNPFNSA